MLYKHRKPWREILNQLYLLLCHFDPYKDMSDEPPLISVVKTSLIFQLPYLAYIMQYRTGNKKVCIHIFITHCYINTEIRNLKRMFKEPAQKGMMDVLSSRRCLK